jgi:hypothetical protein
LILQSTFPISADMDYKQPAVVILAETFVLNALDDGSGMKLTDLPMSAVLSSASSTASVSSATWCFYNTTTDELLEAPAPNPSRCAQT